MANTKPDSSQVVYVPPTGPTTTVKAALDAISTVTVTTAFKSLIADFGAVGDGTTDDTAAILAAIVYMGTSGQSVQVPFGTFLTDPFSIAIPAYASQASFIGIDRERSVLKRRGTGVGAFVTLGSATAISFQAGVGFNNLTVDGGVTTNGHALACYDVVRSNFNDCRFTGGDVGCQMYGGISVSFNNCLFDMSVYGLKIDKFTSLAGGGWPNLIRVNGSEVVDNTAWGVWVDNGRMLTLDGCNIENNGTTPFSTANGGVYVGVNMGAEVLVTDPYSIGSVIRNCWFEGNKGVADVYLGSAANTIATSNFFSTAAQVTNDIDIEGGLYTIQAINCSFTKAANVNESTSALVLPGNLVATSQIPTIAFTAVKTAVLGGDRMAMLGGAVPAIRGMVKPIIQMGYSSGASGEVITFPTPYLATPFVWLQTTEASVTTVTNPKVIAIDASSFTIGKPYTVTGGTVATGSYLVAWIAVGGIA